MSRSYAPCRAAFSAVSGLLRAVCRLMLCLSLWNSPVPLLHAHEQCGPVVDRNPRLAEHVRACHRNDSHAECRHWHVHLVLWGEIQTEQSDSHRELPCPPSRYFESHFALVQNDGYALSQSPLTLIESWGAAPSVIVLETVSLRADHALREEQISPYQLHVNNSWDAAHGRMVIRC